MDNELFLTQNGRARFSTLSRFFDDQTIDDQVNDLKIVKVTFNSPMLLQITRDVKINFVGKLSAIGGNLGLFTGFSIMSFVELMYWFVKIVYTTIMMSCGKSDAVTGVGALRQKRKQLTNSVYF